MSKSAILLSGGLDSMVLLAWLRSKGESPQTAIAFDYGQRHIKELKCAERIAVYYRVINFVTLKIPHIHGSALTGGGDIPHGHYKSPEQKATVVPNRNMIMLATACSKMVGCDYDNIYFAAHAGDAAIYPDCRKEFVDAIDTAMRIATGISVKAPFLSHTKRDIAMLSRQLSVHEQMAWSCYEGGDKPCGLCGACVERAEAFE